MGKQKSEAYSGVKEIARRANVSLATVDRVLHNRTGVSEKTKQKINSIIEELNYQPNLLARTLASRKIYTLAILIPAVSAETAYWQGPLDGINKAEAELAQYGVRTDQYFFDQNDKKSFFEQTKKILQNPPDGILMAPSFIEESVIFTTACKKMQIPYVFINSDIPTTETLCYVGPHLYKSGYLAAHLAKLSNAGKGKMLIINISKEIENHHHLLRKEDGFRSYFKDKHLSQDIIKIDINQTEYRAVEERLGEMFDAHKDIVLMFVTNSRVSSVARYLQKINRYDIRLIGYDFLPENIEYLKNGMIDFLICHKPDEQGYKGIKVLYQYLVLTMQADPVFYMPIDIVTRENFEFYRS